VHVKGNLPGKDDTQMSGTKPKSCVQPSRQKNKPQNYASQR
jgi:hypothetical protein